MCTPLFANTAKMTEPSGFGWLVQAGQWTQTHSISDTKYFKPPIFHCRPIVHCDYDHPNDGGFNLYFVPVWYQALYFQIQSFPLNNKESQSINVTGKENLFIGIKICANSISKV